MLALILAICVTTGVCAFLFFVLPYADHRRMKRDKSYDEHRD
jgi:hypothetical protein